MSFSMFERVNIKNLFYDVAVYLRIVDICRKRTANRIKILMYHGIAADDERVDCWWMLRKTNFEKQIVYIAKYFNVVSIDDAIELVSAHKVRKNTAVITFDDGYKNFLDIAYPILKPYGMPCTVYITSGLTEKRSLIWTDKLFIALHNISDKTLDLSSSGLGQWRIDNQFLRRKAFHRIIDMLKEFPVGKKQEIIEEIFKNVVIDSKHQGIKNGPFDLLTREEVAALSKESLVTIGCHTINHEILTKLPHNEVIQEIQRSKNALEQWTNKRVDHFAYPNGSYNEKIVREIIKMGFRSAVLAEYVNDITNDPYRLSRLGIGAWDTMSAFKCNISGLSILKNDLIH